MLAPQTIAIATLVTIAEPEGGPVYRWPNYLECAVCSECFGDGEPAYIIGAYPPAYLHTMCI